MKKTKGKKKKSNKLISIYPSNHPYTHTHIVIHIYIEYYNKPTNLHIICVYVRPNYISSSQIVQSKCVTHPENYVFVRKSYIPYIYIIKTKNELRQNKNTLRHTTSREPNYGICIKKN